MTFDISQYELVDTAVLTVQNAAENGDLLVDGNPVTITLYGSGSKQNVQARHKADNAQNTRTFAAARGKSVGNMSKEAEKDTNERLAACTAEVSNFPIEPIAIYSNPKLGYIRKQAIKFLDDDANFTPALATNSASSLVT